MNQEVTDYIGKALPWQIKVSESLRKLIHETVPGVEERLQYGKPHYLKNGQYAAVIHIAKDKISFMLFNASGLEPIDGLLRAMGNGERKTIDITEGKEVDYKLVSELLAKSSATIQ
ncbi:MAG: hypothetical protein JWN82_425 [Candidatus Saccharibacteria bacterium]|nr:hypothetical protein [Candidatus Saccharibacteria bacterium]